MAVETKPKGLKMNGKTQMNDPFKRRKNKTYFQLSLIAVIFVIVFAVIYFIAGSGDEPLDYSNADFVQLEEPADEIGRASCRERV